MFCIAALSNVVMKEANLPSYIGLVSFLSVKEVAGFAMPGLPHANNLLAATYLNTDLSVPGLIALVFGLAISVIYVKKTSKKSQGK